MQFSLIKISLAVMFFTFFLVVIEWLTVEPSISQPQPTPTNIACNRCGERSEFPDPLRR